MNVKIVDGYDYPEEVRALFSEYTDMLIANDAEFKKYLAVQNYDEKIVHLKSKYGLPEGSLYVLFADGKSAGCIGLRKIDSQTCEMKRLYIRSAWRGKKVGRDAGRKDYNGSTKNRIFVYGAGYAPVFTKRNPLI